MKRSEIVFSIFQILLDYLALLLAAIIAYSVRFSGFFISFRPAVSLIPWRSFITISAMIAVVWIFIFAFSGLYPIGRPKKFLNEIAKLFAGCSIGFVAVTIMLFLARDVLSSRFIVLAAWALALLLVSLSHLLVRVVRWIAFLSGIGVHRVVLIGNATAHELGPRLFPKYAGYSLIKIFSSPLDETLKEISDLRAANKVDEIFFINPEATQAELYKIKKFTDAHHLKLNYAADPFLISHRNIEFGTLAGIPIVELKKSRLDGWGRVFKSFFDLIFSFLLLAILSPFFLFLGILVKITSRGQIIYYNERLGEDGKKFYALKFRTMHAKHSIGKQFAGQEEALKFEEKLINEQGIKSGPVYKILNDPRVTKFGKFLRRTSLDELPQLWNVVRGEMSLVGPMPHQLREVEKYAPENRKILNIRPGITGLAQISGRADLSFRDEARLDTYYMENWSPWLDLYILLKTPFVVISKKGAY